MIQELYTTAMRPASVASAVATVTEYRENGNGSNRTNWERMTGILSAVLNTISTGMATEVTDLFTDTDSKAPAYHLAHRALSAGAIRPEWQNVQVVTLRTETVQTGKGGIVTGDSTTTGKVGKVRIFITPTV